jgi:tRNA pseudouridine38-40 synthase
MQAAAVRLVGRHDFSSFRASQCQAKSPVREITHFHLVRRGDILVFEVKANAFLHHMVRNMVGALTAIGAGEQPVDWIDHLLAVRDRRQAGVTAKPCGLYLVNVDYPEVFDLPRVAPGPGLLLEPVGAL